MLYLIRHGATPSNEEKPRRLQGCGVDTSLSPRGAEQAREVAAFLQDIPLHAVFSSPLKRAQETAAQIAAVQNLDVCVIDAIHEVNVGRWERLNWATIAQEFPTEYEQFMEDSAQHGYPGGESHRDVAERVAPVFEQLLADNAGKRIAVVAHSVVNRTWLATLLGIPVGHAKDLPQDNCCVNVIRYLAGQTKLLTLNSHFHISE
ncbi:MAG: histidine phosphatase family protein [Planctomycetota bacterium]